MLFLLGECSIEGVTLFPTLQPFEEQVLVFVKKKHSFTDVL